MTVRDTARRVLREQWPILAVGLIFLVSFVLVVFDFWRRGSLLIGVGVGVGAVLRLVLSDDRAGLLVVRSKALDFAMLSLVATAMVYIAWTIDPLGTG